MLTVQTGPPPSATVHHATIVLNHHTQVTPLSFSIVMSGYPSHACLIHTGRSFSSRGRRVHVSCVDNDTVCGVAGQQHLYAEGSRASAGHLSGISAGHVADGPTTKVGDVSINC